MATFQKRKTKTKGQVWDVIFRINDGNNIIQKKISGFPTKRDAQRAYEDFLKNYIPESSKNKPDDSNSSVTFSDAYNEYITVNKNVLAAGTIVNINSIFKIHILPYFEKRRIDSITHSDIVGWQEDIWKKKNRNGELYRQSTCENIFVLFSKFMDWACVNYSLGENPFDNVKYPHRREPKKEMQIWTPEQFNEFLTYVNTESGKIFFTLLFYTGCRKNEINALTTDDFKKVEDGHYDITITKSISQIKDTGKIINPPKTKSGYRTIGLPTGLTKVLDDFLDGKEGQLWGFTSCNWNKMFYRAIKRATQKGVNLPYIRIHDLRHSHASLLVLSGIPVTTVSKHLGHARSSTTLNVYSHPIDSAEKDVLDYLNNIWEIISPALNLTQNLEQGETSNGELSEKKYKK